MTWTQYIDISLNQNKQQGHSFIVWLTVISNWLCSLVCMIAIQATCINTNFSFQVNTIVFPLKSMTGSSSFPVEYAKVQSAYADLSSQPVKSLYRPDKKLTINITLSWGTYTMYTGSAFSNLLSMRYQYAHLLVLISLGTTF